MFLAFSAGIRAHHWVFWPLAVEVYEADDWDDAEAPDGRQVRRVGAFGRSVETCRDLRDLRDLCLGSFRLDSNVPKRICGGGGVGRWSEPFLRACRQAKARNKKAPEAETWDSFKAGHGT